MKAIRSASVAKLVVIIDDDPLILEATEGLLRSWGCCVVAARSCDRALVRLAETEAGRRPDVIVCDYQLSRGVTGVDAIERLRSVFPSPASLPIPAIVISGYARSPSVRGRLPGIPPDRRFLGNPTGLARPLARSIALGASRSDAHCGADIGIKRFCPDNCPGANSGATARFRKA